MRPSKRTEILDAAMRVVERDGLTAVTFEAVAAEADLTKGGLLYHFASRETLLDGLHQHLADAWETALEQACGRPAAEATRGERLAAYARVAARTATRAELLLMVEAATAPERSAPWEEVLRRWAAPLPAGRGTQGGPLPEGEPLPEQQLDLLVARLAADGLWLHDSLAGSDPLPEAVRRQAIAHLVARTRRAE